MSSEKRKVVLVTGSSKGIGLAIAKKLDINGWQVVINGRNDDALNHAKSILPNALAIRADMTIKKEAEDVIHQTIKIYGQLDAIVCNVGSGASQNDDFLQSEWCRMFDINFWSALNIISPSIQFLEKTKGSIICISSICGLEHIPGAPISYSVSKAALNSYVKNMSKKLGPVGIRINAIAPGNILFDDSTWSKKIEEDSISVNKYIKSEVALGGFGSTDDVAFFVETILSQKSSFMTGVILAIDGGQVRS
jgi:NAD(P)-dependent dehydrogenase (short-subunit alcohol dehydrogenase family)